MSLPPPTDWYRRERVVLARTASDTSTSTDRSPRTPRRRTTLHGLACGFVTGLGIIGTVYSMTGLIAPLWVFPGLVMVLAGCVEFLRYETRSRKPVASAYERRRDAARKALAAERDCGLVFVEEDGGYRLLPGYHSWVSNTCWIENWVYLQPEVDFLGILDRTPEPKLQPRRSAQPIVIGELCLECAGKGYFGGVGDFRVCRQCNGAGRINTTVVYPSTSILPVDKDRRVHG